MCDANNFHYYLLLRYAPVDYSHNLHTKSRVLLHLEIWVTYAGESVTWMCDVAQKYEVYCVCIVILIFVSA